MTACVAAMFFFSSVIGLFTIFIALWASFGARIAYLVLKSRYMTLLGKPLRQILIPSNTPLHVSWCITRKGSTKPGFLWLLGTIQRIKEGSVLINMLIKL